MEHFPTSESAQRMLDTVTKGFYDNSYVAKWIFQVIGQEYDNAEKIAEELPKQFFPETATWGLKYHELKWGLPIRENLTYEERRRLIFQKRDFKAPMTPFRMETYLRNAIDFEVHISDCYDTGEYGFCPEHPNVFKAVFIGEGTLNTKVVREILDNIKQSHTVYTINDRVIDVIDNRNLEQIEVSKLSLQISFLFWNAHLMDGSWLLDGRVLLDSEMQTFPVHIVIRKIQLHHKLNSEMNNILIRSSVKEHEQISVKDIFFVQIPLDRKSVV